MKYPVKVLPKKVSISETIDLDEHSQITVKGIYDHTDPMPVSIVIRCGGKTAGYFFSRVEAQLLANAIIRAICASKIEITTDHEQDE